MVEIGLRKSVSFTGFRRQIHKLVEKKHSGVSGIVDGTFYSS